MLAAISGVFLSLHFILWFVSLNYTSVASSVVLVTLQPLFAFIGTYVFFGERFYIAAIISMLITLFGSFIIGWGDLQISDLALLGAIIAFVGCITVLSVLMFAATIGR